MNGKIKWISIALCVLLIAPVFSGVLGGMVGEINRNIGSQSSNNCAFSGSNPAGVYESVMITPEEGIWIDKDDEWVHLRFNTMWKIVGSGNVGSGQVKIKQELKGSSWDVSNSYKQPSQSTFAESEIDLTDYGVIRGEGQYIWIVFYYMTSGCDYCGGWWVDDIEVVTGKRGVIYKEDFESYEVGDEYGECSVDTGFLECDPKVANWKIDERPAPDPYIYCQDVVENPIWDNPDIQLWQEGGGDWGETVGSSMLNCGQIYKITAEIHNKGDELAQINVKFFWSSTALNFVDQFNGFSDTEDFATNEIKDIEVEKKVGSEEGVETVEIFWDTGVVGDPGSEEEVVHSCIRVEIIHLNGDKDDTNNKGQENCDVHGCKPETITDTIEIPFPVDNPTGLIDGITVEISQQEYSIWEAAEIDLPELPPYSEGLTAIFRLIPPIDMFVFEDNGYSEKFQLTARRKDTGEIIGGLEIKVVVDNPPTLDWTGDTGYVDDAVEPDEGNAGDVFFFKAKYTDKNNDAPASGTPLLYVYKGDELIKGAPFLMEEEDPTDTEYTDGKLYTSSITLSEPGDDYTYLIWARDSYGVPAEGLSKDGPTVLPEKQLLTGVHSTFTMYCGSVHLYVRVVDEEHSGVIYDIEILPHNQKPFWDSVEGIEAPEGWNFEKIGNGVRFYTETNPLLTCHRTKFTFRVTAKRISWYIRIHVTDQNHQNLGMIVSTKWWLYYYPVWI